MIRCFGSLSTHLRHGTDRANPTVGQATALVRALTVGGQATAVAAAQTVGRQLRRRRPPLHWSAHRIAFLAIAVGILSAGVDGGVTARVSVSSSSEEGNADSSRASISADGRYVAFYSDAHNLVPGDKPPFDPDFCPACSGVRDVFVRDRQTDTTVRVSVSSAGAAANGKCDRPSISADGRFVAFTSDADNLVTGDENGIRDIFVHDRDADEDGVFDEPGAISTTRVSVSSTGTAGNDRSNMPVISADGRFVAFRSRATNLIAAGTSGVDHIFIHDRQTGATVLASVSASGVEGNLDSDRPALSADGRFVAFFSDADNLVPGDTEGQRDVFVRDRDPDENGIFDEGNATMERASASSGGVAGNGFSSRPKLSADGRYVLFKSLANNLVTGDTNNADDVFVRDRLTNTTVRVSVSTQGAEATGFGPVSQRASVSHDGRYVAFISEADDLVPNDTNLSKDIFVRDRQTGTTVRVSVSSAGHEGNDDSNRPSISADGRYVAFYSDAYNLIAEDDPTYDPALCPDCTGVRDIFVHDRDADADGIFDEPGAITTTRVSVSSGGDPANVDCTRPSISGDGRYVAFRSTADNLVTGDTNGLQDIFVHDRQSAVTVRVSVSSSGSQTIDGNSDRPSISGDGRFVAFWSKAGNLVPGDDPPYDPILCPFCIGVADIFVHDRDADVDGIFDEPAAVATKRVSVSSLGVAANADSDRPWMGTDGCHVGFISEATNLVSGDTNNHTDVFVHDLQTSSTVRVSVGSSGVEGNFGSRRVTLSADGRFVAFRSKSDDLVAGDAPSYDIDLCPTCTGVRDVFLHDRDPDMNGIFDQGNGVTTRVSVSTGGDPGDRDTGGPKLSGDGTVLAMVGTATNLVAGDTNNSDDVLARNLTTSVTERVSVSSSESQASSPIAVPPDSDDPAMSSNGRFVAFRGFGVNLVPTDTNLQADVFLHDRDVDEDGVFDEFGDINTRRVSVNCIGLEGDLGSGGAKISANGNLVAYYSDATDLVPGDSNLARDVFAFTVVVGGCINELCDDGSFCNGLETCSSPTCTPGDPGCCLAGTRPCYDGDECTDDLCDEVGHSCSFPPDHPTDIFCCDPADGILTLIDDGRACTDDLCDPDTGVVTHDDLPPGTACNDGDPCTQNDECDAVGNCAGTPLPNCACNSDGECNDSIDCTVDRCIGPPDGVCEHTPDDSLCVEDGVHCNGEEVCDLSLGCVSAGEPCPGCNEGGNPPCPCEAPNFRGAGPRYLAIRPEPIDSTVPVRFLVTSSADWPCLSKYVGSLKCGGSGDACRSDADCNECSGTRQPCLTDGDCDFGRCDNGQECSVAAQNCLDQSTCVRTETCVLSGDLCAQAPLDPIDINNDGLADGALAVLVDDPADAAEYTPLEWTLGVRRCSKSAAPCDADGDCPRGRCEQTGATCNVFEANPCLGGLACRVFETCESGAVFVYGEGVHPSDYDFTNQALVPTQYEVQAECTVVIPPVSTTMWRWADTNNNGFVNVSDLQLIILAIQGHYDFSTVLNDDLAGDSACTPQQILNVTDILVAKRAFQGEAFADIACVTPCE